MLNKEIEILNDIYTLLSEVDLFEFDSFKYTYKLNKEEGWSSMSVIYKLNESIVSQNDFDFLNENLLEELSESLRSLMFSKTGGEWTKFVLSFEDDKVNTKFEYNVQSLV